VDDTKIGGEDDVREEGEKVQAKNVREARRLMGGLGWGRERDSRGARRMFRVLVPARARADVTRHWVGVRGKVEEEEIAKSKVGGPTRQVKVKCSPPSVAWLPHSALPGLAICPHCRCFFSMKNCPVNVVGGGWVEE
jgi:hypothetical protein